MISVTEISLWRTTAEAVCNCSEKKWWCIFKQAIWKYQQAMLAHTIPLQALTLAYNADHL